MTNFRLRLLFAPAIETKLYLGENIEEIADLIFSSVNVLEKFKHSALFTIPNDYKAYFYQHKKLKIALDLLTRPQSNILFESVRTQEFCTEEDAEILFPVGFANFSARKILNLLSEKKFPLFVDIETGHVTKVECAGCANLHACTNAFDEETVSNLTYEKLINLSVGIARKSLDLYKSLPNSINREELSELVAITAVYNGVKLNDLVQASSFDFVNELIDDLRDVEHDELQDAAYCMYRAIAYPSSQDGARRTEKSVDWHKNTDEEWNGFRLFRCDVVGAGRTGLRGSGAKRLLFAIHKDKKYFLAYTDTHDFSDSMLNIRTESLKNLLKSA